MNCTKITKLDFSASRFAFEDFINTFRLHSPWRYVFLPGLKSNFEERISCGTECRCEI